MTGDTAARSALVYAALSAFVVLTAIVVRFVPAGPLANALALPIVAFVIGAGVIGLLLVRRAGIPAVLDPTVTARWRFAVPAIAGVAFGVMTVLHSLLAPGHTPVTPFPISILVFAAGGIMLEILLRLVGITVPTALFGTLGPKARTAAFWIAAVATSLYEPLPFIFDAVHGHASPLLIALRLFLFNLTGAMLYRKAGLLAALSERWAEYGVWHIIGQSLFKLQ